MFSANENFQLRQHKRRIVQQVEACLPDRFLCDGETNVMVMQVACQALGCVPLETAILILFPTEFSVLEQLPDDVVEDHSFKTKILKPMAEVTDDDVKQALPVSLGGTRTWQGDAIRIRDVLLAQIDQAYENVNIPNKTRVAQYLQQALQEYMDNKCVAPEYGQAFEKNDEKEVDQEPPSTTEAATGIAAESETDIVSPTMNGAKKFEHDDNQDTQGNDTTTSPGDNLNSSLAPTSSSAEAATTTGPPNAPSTRATTSMATTPTPTTPTTTIPTTTTSITSAVREQRQRQRQERQFWQATTTAPGIHGGPPRRPPKRLHAAAQRRPGCPCCDISTTVGDSNNNGVAADSAFLLS
ncbi:hypothetical protein ACA910_008489 [Epithemia clementina (nom. ined.)]